MAQSILRNTRSHPWYSWYFTSKSKKNSRMNSKYSKASTSSSNIGGKSRNLPHHTSSANSAPPPPELWISRGQEQHAEPQRSREREREQLGRQRGNLVFTWLQGSGQPACNWTHGLSHHLVGILAISFLQEKDKRRTFKRISFKLST